MTTHGTAWASMQNAATRALRREIKRDKIEAWKKKQKDHARHSEAYRKAVADNRRLGLPVPHGHSELHNLLALDKRWKRPVTMPGSKADEHIDPRGAAEERMIEVIRTAVEVLSAQLNDLSHVPNPRYSYHNRVNQKVLADLIGRLARSVNPACKLSFGLDIDEPRVLIMEHCCVDCGGPANTMSRAGVWYCWDCLP